MLHLENVVLLHVEGAKGWWWSTLVVITVIGKDQLLLVCSGQINLKSAE